MKSELNKIRVDKSNAYKIGRMIEDICDKYNLHNYFGLISTTVAYAGNIVLSALNDDERIIFTFNQCIGGVSFSLKSERNIFENLDFNIDYTSQSPELIIKMLTNEVYIQQEGKELEMVFYVNGIEPAQLLTRQDKLKTYFKKNLVKN
ncbi:MAG: hypothetical protein LBR28_00545 [Bacteroidales bacterium]|jgi:hypothetical protein|nr:hypothetical protein [Bacteroidales bacterium]